MDNRIIDLLDRIKEELVFLLASNLVGIYLHGSLAFDCFSWEQSDVDFLIVVKEEVEQEEKEQIIRLLLEIEQIGPKKGFEMSVVAEEVLRPPQFPMPYLLHYSILHRKKAQENLALYCRQMQGVDLDLTTHAMVLCQKGLVLYGEPIERVFQAPTRKDYLESIWYDIEDSLSMVQDDPVSTILNLCRTLAYVREDRFLSKREGGQWALGHYALRYKAMLEEVLDAYQEGSTLIVTSLMSQFVEECLEELEGIFE